jgi:hypothetical protein
LACFYKHLFFTLILEFFIKKAVFAWGYGKSPEVWAPKLALLGVLEGVLGPFLQVYKMIKNG